MLIFETDHVADVAPRVRVVVDIAVNINTAGAKLLEETNHGRASRTCMGIINFPLFRSSTGKFHTSIDPHGKRGSRRVLVARLEEPPATPKV